MSNPLLALLNNAGSHLSPSATPTPAAAAPSPPSPPSTTLSSPSSASTALPTAARSPPSILSHLSPSGTASITPYAGYTSLLSLLAGGSSSLGASQSVKSPPLAPADQSSKTSSSYGKDAEQAAAPPSSGSREGAIPPAATPQALLLGLLAGAADTKATESNPSDPDSTQQIIKEPAEKPAPSSSSYAHAAAAPSKFDFQSSFNQLASEPPSTAQDSPHTLDTGAIGGDETVRRPGQLQKEMTGRTVLATDSIPDTQPTDAAVAEPSENPSKEKDTPPTDQNRELEPARDLLASLHLAALHRDNSFSEDSTSGLKVSKTSTDTVVYSFDLAASQPAGPRSLHPAKLEISQIALVATPFAFHAVDIFARGSDFLSSAVSSHLAQLHTSKITNLGLDVVAYVMKKGRVRLLDLRAGHRAILQLPSKRSIAAIRAFAVNDEKDWRIVATYDTEDDGSSEGVFIWKVTLDEGFQTEGLSSVSSVLSGNRLVASQEGSQYSYEANLCAILASKENQAKKKVHLIPDFEALTKWSPSSHQRATLTHTGSVIAASVASHCSTYVAIEAGDTLRLIARKSTGESQATFTVPPLPRQDAQGGEECFPPVTFFAPLYSQEPTDTEPIGVLVGFAKNSIIGLLDLGGDWRYVWRFDSLPSGHFNLAHLHEDSATLFLANSARSSIFSVKLPTSRTAVASIPTEFALPEPCTSFTIIGKQGTVDDDGVRVLAIHPGGVLSFDLPLQVATHRTEAEEATAHESAPISANMTEGRDEVKAEENSSSIWQDREGNLQKEATQDVAVTGDGSATPPKYEVTPLVQGSAEHTELDKAPISSQDSTAPLELASEQISSSSRNEVATAPPGSISMAEQGRTYSSRRGTRGGSKNKKTPANDDSAHHSRNESTATSKSTSNGAATNGKEGDRPRAEVEVDGKLIAFDTSTIQKDLQSMEARLTEKLKSLFATATSNNSSGASSPSTHLPPGALARIAEDVASGLASQVESALVPGMLASIKAVTEAEMRNGFSQALQQSLPAELARMIQRPDVNNLLTRSITSGVIPIAQRTAVEVVTKVLAPHFEQSMLDVVQRVEATVVSGLTDVRKSIVVEQSTALKATEKSLADMAKALHQMSEQLSELSTQNKMLSQTMEEMKRNSSTATTGTGQSTTSPSSLARQFSPAQSQSPWVPVEPFQSPFAQPGSFGAAARPTPSSHGVQQHPHRHPGPPFGATATTPLPFVAAQAPAPPPAAVADNEAVEDILLSALSSTDPETAILPVLQRLKAQYGRAEDALLDRDPMTGSQKLKISQAVLLALLNTISNISKNRPTAPASSGGGVVLPPTAAAAGGGFGPEVFVPWAEACAMNLNASDGTIEAAYRRIGGRIRTGFEEGWSIHHLAGPARWWTRERFEIYLLRYLPPTPTPPRVE